MRLPTKAFSPCGHTITRMRTIFVKNWFWPMASASQRISFLTTRFAWPVFGD